MSDTRSGSTLLENLLSKSQETFSVGELRLFESYVNKGFFGHTLNWQCSCGETFDECLFWSKVTKDLNFEYGYDKVYNTVIQTKSSKNKYYKYFDIGTELIENEINQKAYEYLNALYQCIFKHSKGDIIIDSSKEPQQALAVYKKLKFDVKVIFLKRDICDVVFSKKKWNKGNKYHILLNSKIYDIRCRKVFSKIAPKDKLYIRYEELSKDPQKLINQITGKFGLKPYEAPEYMFIENDHTIAGTPNKTKKRKIKYDNKWKNKIKENKTFSFLAKLIDIN